MRFHENAATALGTCGDWTRDPCPKHIWRPAIPHVDARFQKHARETVAATPIEMPSIHARAGPYG